MVAGSRWARKNSELACIQVILSTPPAGQIMGLYLARPPCQAKATPAYAPRLQARRRPLRLHHVRCDAAIRPCPATQGETTPDNLPPARGRRAGRPARLAGAAAGE